MTPLALADKIVQLLEEARTLPSCRESAFVVMKLQEAYLWLIEMRATQDREDTP